MAYQLTRFICSLKGLTGTLICPCIYRDLSLMTGMHSGARSPKCTIGLIHERALILFVSFTRIPDPQNDRPQKPSRLKPPMSEGERNERKRERDRDLESEPVCQSQIVQSACTVSVCCTVLYRSASTVQIAFCAVAWNQTDPLTREAMLTGTEILNKNTW